MTVLDWNDICSWCWLSKQETKTQTVPTDETSNLDIRGEGGPVVDTPEEDLVDEDITGFLALPDFGKKLATPDEVLALESSTTRVYVSHGPSEDDDSQDEVDVGRHQREWDTIVDKLCSLSLLTDVKLQVSSWQSSDTPAEGTFIPDIARAFLGSTAIRSFAIEAEASLADRIAARCATVLAGLPALVFLELACPSVPAPLQAMLEGRHFRRLRYLDVRFGEHDTLPELGWDLPRLEALKVSSAVSQADYDFRRLVRLRSVTVVTAPRTRCRVNFGTQCTRLRLLQATGDVAVLGEVEVEFLALTDCPKAQELISHCEATLRELRVKGDMTVRTRLDSISVDALKMELLVLEDVRLGSLRFISEVPLNTLLLKNVCFKEVPSLKAVNIYLEAWDQEFFVNTSRANRSFLGSPTRLAMYARTDSQLGYSIQENFIKSAANHLEFFATNFAISRLGPLPRLEYAGLRSARHLKTLVDSIERPLEEVVIFNDADAKATKYLRRRSEEILKKLIVPQKITWNVKRWIIQERRMSPKEFFLEQLTGFDRVLSLN